MNSACHTGHHVTKMSNAYNKAVTASLIPSACSLNRHTRLMHSCFTMILLLCRVRTPSVAGFHGRLAKLLSLAILYVIASN